MISAESANRIEMSIRTNYHKEWRSETNYSPEGYKADLAAHLHNRLNDDRGRIIPWLDNAQPIRGSRILEIGCGTGSSTVALAEQGAIVTGIDIDKDALLVARDRCAAYGLQATFMPLNGQHLAGAFRAGSFDLIIFFACLEHMTTKERLESLRQAWDLLPSNGLLAIIETPNRLWFYDEHTSWLPLFHWLPNELAFYYSKMSNRENFRELYRDYFAETKQHFLRRGRGMSFHEIDLAIAPVSTLNIISSLEGFGKYPRGTSALGQEFKAIMQRILPDIHIGFFDEYLDLIFRKCK
jgi:2-polyprenyl-3-methyl-5-hydroxy-6-metoxy-1,4-benzoquinol methylase